MEHNCLVIARAHGEHETDRTPTAPPSWLIEAFLPNEFPNLRLVLRLLLIHGLTLPNSYFLILTHSGYHITHESNIAAPCYITDPVFMGLFALISHTQLIDNFKFLISRILLPDLDGHVHASGDESSRAHIHFIFCVFLLVDLLGHQEAGLLRWTP